MTSLTIYPGGKAIEHLFEHFGIRPAGSGRDVE